MTVQVKKEHNMIWLDIRNQKKEQFTGMTDYSDELFGIISASSWYVKKPKNGHSKYIFSSKYGKYLHQVIMESLYGKDHCRKMLEDNYVIDHLDNNGLNCQFENLAFLKHIKNLHFKGNVIDKTQRKQIPVAALSIYKTAEREFQITIAFNVRFINDQGQAMSRVCLLYKDRDYDFVLYDVSLIQDFIETGHIDFNDLRYNDSSWQPMYQIQSDKEIKPGTIVNGLIVLGDGCRIIKAAPDRNL